MLATATVAALVQLLAGMPAPWLLLSACAVITVGVTAWGLLSGRFLEPLPVVMSVCALMFVARPLQMFLDWPDLFSHFFPENGARGLVLLANQEIAFYVTERLRGSLETALTTALGACALFLLMAFIGYLLPLGGRLSRSIVGIGEKRAAINLRVAAGTSLLIGFVAQIAIIARAGGPAESLRSSANQSVLSDSFVLFVLAGFGFAGMVVWAAWRRPASRLEWAAFALCVVANCAFAIIAGSRARVFLALLMLAVIKHYLWRPWRVRYLVAGLLAFAVFASGFIAFRQEADVGSLGSAAAEAPKYALEPRVLLNDITSFDALFYATTIYGERLPHEHGAFLLGGVRSYIPSALDPAKPEGGDIVLRRVAFGNRFGAGRPPTVVGDLYIDFGFAGVIAGALLVGIAARSMLGLLLGEGAGRQYRVALYAILLVVLYELVVDTSSIALGYALTFGLPFLFAVYVLGRFGPRRPSRLRGQDRV
jgi:oligosaccharide repeat unit polymerase